MLPLGPLFERLPQHGQYSGILRESQFLPNRDRRFEIQYGYVDTGLDLNGPCVRVQVLPSS
jgi:hypothetical protein